MKKLLLSLVLSTGLYANMATVDCTEMSKIMNIMQGITKVCQVDTEIHTFIQDLDIDGSGTLTYENGEQLVFMTTDKVLSVNVEADRPFIIKIKDYVSPRLKLTILTDGDESWKFFYEGTRRWRNYNFDVIITASVELTSRIIYEDKSPASDVLVHVVTDTNTFQSRTDANGVFNTFVTLNSPFILKAFNTLNTPESWAFYENKIRVNNDFITEEEVDGKWVELAKDFMVKGILPEFLTDKGTLDFKRLNRTAISFTPTDASITNQGIRMILALEAGKEYTVTFKTNHNISLWIADYPYTKMYLPNRLVEGGTTSTDTFTATGQTSVYFAPKEQANYIITDIVIEEVLK